jgi:triosephosphate isomerase
MADRRYLIAGNWKMFKTSQEAAATAAELKQRVSEVTQRDIMIAPPFTALSAVADVVDGSNISLGGQNMHWEHEGAFTGEVSATMLTAAGCRYVIIGHSERRQFFAETDRGVNRKCLTASAAGLAPVVCIGESETQRENGETFSVLDKQIKIGLENFVPPAEGPDLVIAYEPVWAIGTGKAATSDQAQEVHAFIRDLLAKLYDARWAEKTRILYGGSVKPSNVDELMAKPDVDGALVGGASLDAETFSRLVHFSE